MEEIKQTVFHLDEDYTYSCLCPICSKHIVLTQLCDDKFQTTSSICNHFKDIIMGQMGNVFGAFQEIR